MDFDLNLSFLPSSQDSELNDDDLQAMEITAVPENTKLSTNYGIKKFEKSLKSGSTSDRNVWITKTSNRRYLS